MKNKKIILKSNEAHELINNAIMENRVCRNGKLLTPSEIEELIYYLLEQEYNNSYIRLTKDCETEEQRIIDQIRFGDIRVRLDKEDINVEVKSEKPYMGLYKLRIDLQYIKTNGDCYFQSNTNNSLGWAYHIMNYDKIYVHFHDCTSKYKASIYVINNPYRLYMDIMKLLQRDNLNFDTPYNVNGVNFELFKNYNDRNKVTICTSFNLLEAEARERYNIDLIHLEIKLE